MASDYPTDPDPAFEREWSRVQRTARGAPVYVGDEQQRPRCTHDGRCGIKVRGCLSTSVQREG